MIIRDSFPTKAVVEFDEKIGFCHDRHIHVTEGKDRETNRAWSMSVVKRIFRACSSEAAKGWVRATRSTTLVCKDEKPSSEHISNEKLRRLVFKWSGFNRYGLYHDDCLDPFLPDVAIALRRIPNDVMDARNFRLIRAAQLSCRKQILPKEMWITFDEDRAYRYLRPYIEEVEQERIEAREFGCINHYGARDGGM